MALKVYVYVFTLCIPWYFKDHVQTKKQYA